MKKVLFLILLFAGVLWVNAYLSNSDGTGKRTEQPCDEPITYRIGMLNSTYDLSEQELQHLLEEIDQAWSAQIGKDLFAYEPEGSIAINLVYSDQQRLLNKQKLASSRIRLEKNLYQKGKSELQDLKKKYKIKKEEYQNFIEQYNRLGRKAYAQSSDQEQNSQIQQKLEEDERTIKTKQEELTRLRNAVNIKITELNNLSGRINDMVADYNEVFSSPREFNQGNYQRTENGESINIYSYENLNELKLLLAHEMGHALGLGHVQNSRSVMYYLIANQKMNILDFTDEDIRALKTICGH